MGMGSRIHQAAQSVVMPAVARAGAAKLVREAKTPVTKRATPSPIAIRAPRPKVAKLATLSRVGAAQVANSVVPRQRGLTLRPKYVDCPLFLKGKTCGHPTNKKVY